MRTVNAKKCEHLRSFVPDAWYLSLRRGELAASEQMKAKEHLQECSTCRFELAGLEVLEAQLADSQGEPLPTNFAPETTELLIARAATRRRSKEPWVTSIHSFLRRFSPRPLVLVSATILMTLFLQLTLWNPILGQTEIRTVFAFSPAPEIQPEKHDQRSSVRDYHQYLVQCPPLT